MTDSGQLFEGFGQRRIPTSGAEINVRVGGSGPPLLLLHGFPQTHAMWHQIAPALAATHTVVVPDLRGYGDSSTPPGGDDHAGYSFRAMAADQVEVMRTLGHQRFAVVGHDRGARVTHRMALDHPEAVERLAMLDIVPTRHVYGHTDKRLATVYYHWFFLIQPDELPERLIGNDPIYYLHSALGSFGSGLDSYAPAAPWPSTKGVSPTHKHGTRCAKTTEPPPLWTSSTTRPILAAGCSSPRWSCGAPKARSAPCTNRSRFGVTTPPTYAAIPSTPAISWWNNNPTKFSLKSALFSPKPDFRRRSRSGPDHIDVVGATFLDRESWRVVPAVSDIPRELAFWRKHS
ncbi:alpha/beta fold hydrolase [Fodinicola feengrottensis]|uniref:alpha/beta fold hydrolase n=1 Tax=Fodinicola feengrottensis TaxID=435914 RepID=UPI002443698C|nr:alpha/beta hydrolase [Fodinicola feengrottensis]